MDKKVKMWAVKWTKQGAKDYEIKPDDILVGGELCDDDKWQFAEIVLFKCKKDAKRYCKCSKDWELAVVELEILK